MWAERVAVPLRARQVCIWDSRLAHGNVPNQSSLNAADGKVSKEFNHAHICESVRTYAHTHTATCGAAARTTGLIWDSRLAHGNVPNQSSLNAADGKDTRTRACDNMHMHAHVCIHTRTCTHMFTHAHMH